MRRLIYFLPSHFLYKRYTYHPSSRNSRISPGWQSNSRQRASRVEKRTALAFPVFRMERLAGVRSILSANSPNEIFRFAIITSRFTIMGIGSLFKWLGLVLPLSWWLTGIHSRWLRWRSPIAWDIVKDGKQHNEFRQNS